jgi:hypothetical protein
MKFLFTQKFFNVYFTVSLIVAFGYFFVGCLDGSREMFPNWIYFAPIAFLNVVIGLILGLRPSDEI